MTKLRGGEIGKNFLLSMYIHVYNTEGNAYLNIFISVNFDNINH